MQTKQRPERATDTTLRPHEWAIRHADYLYAYALGRLHDEEQARDLMQETFLAALEKAAGFRGESTERTWLTAILKHKLVDIYRKNASRLMVGYSEAEPRDGDFFDPDLGHWTLPHRPQHFGMEEQDPASRRELAHILQLCMKKLPGLWLSVFTMKHMDEEATEAICQALRVSAANFWVIMHRAKLNLRACLQKNWL